MSLSTPSRQPYGGSTRCLRGLSTYLARRLTPAGRALLLIWFVSGLMGSSDLNIPIYHIWSFATVTLVLAWFLAFFATPKLQLTRRPLTAVRADTTLTYAVDVYNPSRRAAYEITLSEWDLPTGLIIPEEMHAVHISRLGPRQSTRVFLSLHCQKRGLYALSGLCAASPLPLGVCQSICLSLQTAQLMVYPAYTLPSTLPLPRGRHATGNGARSSVRAGASTDFLHTREYRAGDDPRLIHWPSWARLGTPTVKIYQEEEGIRTGLVLDTAVRQTEGVAAFEAAISMTAGIAAYLIQKQYPLGLLLAGDTIPHVHKADTLTPILEQLACLNATSTTQWQDVTSVLCDTASGLSAVIFILLDWSSAVTACVDQLTTYGIGSRMIIVRSGSTSMIPPIWPPERYWHISPTADWSWSYGPGADSSTLTTV